jgi:hypothetical protein
LGNPFRPKECDCSLKGARNFECVVCRKSSHIECIEDLDLSLIGPSDEVPDVRPFCCKTCAVELNGLFQPDLFQVLLKDKKS